jgi:hypothetical protein
MNRTDNTKQERHGILLLKCLHLPKPAQQRLNFKDDIQSNLRMCGKYCLWGVQTNHINVNYMKYLGH